MNLENINLFKNIKCVFLDIDNTLTNDDGRITQHTSKTLKKLKSKGIYVVLCTGRTNQYAIQKSKECNGSPIVISDNGNLIYNYDMDKTYYESVIPSNILKLVWDLSLNQNVDCVLNTIYTRYRHFKYINNDYIKTNNFISDIEQLKENVTQIVINSKNYNDLKTCQTKISQIKELEITNTNLNLKRENKSYFCDINMKGNSKGLAIEKLLKILNIKQDEVICFGDSMNDYSMFQFCKYCIAMKNSDNDLKNKAFAVTKYNNNEDGVARFIEKYIL